MHPKNIYATRTALTGWAGQSYVNKADGVSVVPRIESFGANTRVAIEVQRLGSYLTTIYAYATAAIRNADTGRDVNVGSIVYGETNGPLAFWSGSAWVTDTFVVSTALRAALSALASSLTIPDGVPIPGPQGTTNFSDLTGKPTTIAGYGITDDLRLTTTYTPVGTGATASSVQKAIEDGLAKSYGYFGLSAVENGTTASQYSKLLDALQSGFVVDLKGLTFNFDGDLWPSAGSFKGLINGKLKLGTPGSVKRGLFLRNHSGFVVRNVEVVGSGVYTSGDIGNNGLIWIDNSSDFDVVDAKASKGGPGNGIAILGCDGFTLDRARVSDMNYDLATATDDVINGIWINNCSQFSVRDPRVTDFTGKIASVASKRFTRGLTLSGNSRFTVIGGMNRNVDQGVDFTGSVGNKHFVIADHVAYLNETFGFKFANTAQEASAIGCTSVLARGAGFVVSPAADSSISASLETQNLRISDCRAINPGGSSIFANWSGLAITLGSNKPDYPQGIRIDNFTAVDDRGAGALMKYGVSNEIPHPGNTSFRRNTITGLDSRGHTIAARQGFHELYVNTAGSGTTSITDSTWTAVDFTGTDVEDSSAMHDPSSNANIVRIWESALYEISGNVNFVADATGIRGARLQVSGTPVTGTTQILPAIATASTETIVKVSGIVRLTAGQYVVLECFQNRGSALNVNRAASKLTVRKIAD